MLRILMLLVGLSVFPAMSWANEGGGESDGGPAIEYIEMKPKFAINLVEPKKYLMANVQLMVEGDKEIEKVKKNMPAIKNALIMLYSGLSINDVQSMEQREALRLKTKDEIRNVLDKYANSDGFRDVFFTEFLVN